VEPIFDLPEYKGLKLARTTRTVTGERVDMYIDAMRRHEADFVPVEEGPALPGDRLTVRASMECDGEAVWEAENEIAHVTEDALVGLPGIVGYSEIKELKLGEEKTFEVKVVDGFKEEALRGKDAKLTLRIREMKRPSLPPLDDEAARRLGSADAESLRGEARERLEALARSEAREGLERQVTDELVGAADFELPQGLLAQESRRQQARQMLRLAQLGIAPDSLEEEHVASIRSSARESSDRRLKLSLILGKIAEAEHIEIADDDLENEIYRYALARRRTPVSVRSELERSGGLEDLRAEMLSAKVINFIVEQADITGAQEDSAASAEAGSPEGGAQ
jgi:trigger factor